MKRYLIEQNAAFICEAWADDEGQVHQVDYIIDGYWGSGARVMKNYDYSPGPARLCYPSGGYESNAEKWKHKPYMEERMNIIRAENFSAAIRHASDMMFMMDEGRKIDNPVKSFRIDYIEEIEQ